MDDMHLENKKVAPESHAGLGEEFAFPFGWYFDVFWPLVFGRIHSWEQVHNLDLLVGCLGKKFFKHLLPKVVR